MAAFTDNSQVHVGDRIRCIFVDSLGLKCSVYGKIGIVVHADEAYVEVDWEDGWTSSRVWNYARSFEPVEDGVTITIKPLSKECPCGIFRADCEYHKP